MNPFFPLHCCCLVRQIPYVREDTKFLIDFIEEERYQHYAIMDGPMGPYSTL